MEIQGRQVFSFRRNRCMPRLDQRGFFVFQRELFARLPEARKLIFEQAR